MWESWKTSMREMTSKCHLCQTRLQLRSWPTLREAHIKKSVVLAKEDPTSVGWPSWWSSSHGVPTSTSSFPSKPQPKPTPQNEIWLITAPLRSFHLSPCFHFQIMSLSVAPTGLSRRAKTDLVQEATRSPTLKCTPLCTLVCLQVTTNPQTCVGVFLSSQVIQNKQTDPSLLG